MPLTDTAIRNAKARDKAYRLFDERGLYLEIAPSGGKWWRFKYRYAGKEKRLSLGTYPDVGLKDARERRDEARKLLTNGTDPAEHRKATRRAAVVAAANSFEAVGREWLATHGAKWTADTQRRITKRVERELFPALGKRPIAEITAPEVLEVLRKVEGRGVIETAHRVHRDASRIFRYAIATHRAERDPAGDLRGALKPVSVTHHAAITRPTEVAGLMRAIECYQGHAVARAALRLLPLVFVRPGELRAAEWPEFDLDGATWRIPAERMKMRQAHVVPLATQAVDILREHHKLTGRGRYVFPSIRTGSRCMSENTINAALRRLGYSKDEMTAHGFRTMASTILNEQGWSADAIERQLAHAERDDVRAAYNRAEHLPERRRMMQAWADYLEGLARGADVVEIRANE